MWVLIIIGVAAIALGTWAFWPRGAGVTDGRVLSSRRSTHGGVEGRFNQNRNAWPF